MTNTHSGYLLIGEEEIDNLILGIAHENRALIVGSRAFESRNPGLLTVDRTGVPSLPDGTRVFGTFQGGVRALSAKIGWLIEKVETHTLAEVCTMLRWDHLDNITSRAARLAPYFKNHRFSLLPVTEQIIALRHPLKSRQGRVYESAAAELHPARFRQGGLVSSR